MVEFNKEHDSNGVAAWQGDLPEEMMLELKTDMCVGVEWFQAKGTACTIVLQKEAAKHILRAKQAR